MAYTIRCPQCDLALQAPGELLGRTATCSGCDHQFIVSLPEPTTPSKQADTAAAASPHTTRNVKRASKGASKGATGANVGSDREIPRQAGSQQSSAELPTAGRPLGLSGSSPRVARFKGLPGDNGTTGSAQKGSLTPQAVASPDRAPERLEQRRASAVGSSAAPASTSHEPTGSQEHSASHEQESNRSHALPDASSGSHQASRRDAEGDQVSAETLPVSEDNSTNSAQARLQRRRRRRSTSATPQNVGGRQRKSARFVEGEQLDTRLTLGADGTLPHLVVNSDTPAADELPDNQEAPPWTLIGALALSVLLSLAILVIPTESTRVRRSERAQRLDHLREHYFGEAPLAEHQRLLRQAVRHENRGERVQARDLYRAVLDHLRSEGVDPAVGVSGPRFAFSPPNDRDLEETLQILLRRRE